MGGYRNISFEAASGKSSSKRKDEINIKRGYLKNTHGFVQTLQPSTRHMLGQNPPALLPK